MPELFTTVLILTVAAIYRSNPRNGLFIYLFAIALFPFYWTPVDVFALNKLSVQRLVALGIGVGLVIEFFGRSSGEDKTNTKYEETKILLLILLWSVSLFATRSTTVAIRGTLFYIIDYGVPFIIALRFIGVKDHWQSLYKMIVFFGCVVAIVAVDELLTQAPLAFDLFSSLHFSEYEYVWRPAARAGLLRVQATFGQSIFLAFFLGTSAIISFTLYQFETKIGAKTGYLVAAILLLGTSFVPLARGAALATIFGFIMIFTLISKRNIAPVILFLIGGGAILWIGGIIFPELFGFWSDFITAIFGGGSSSLQQSQLKNYDYRLSILFTVYELFIKAPMFGFGDVLAGGANPIADVTNVFLQVALAWGIIGITTFVGFLFYQARKVYIIWQMEKNTTYYVVAAGLIAQIFLVLMCFLVSSWPGQFTQVIWMIFGSISGLYVRAKMVGKGIDQVTTKSNV